MFAKQSTLLVEAILQARTLLMGQPPILRPHMPVESAGMALCFVRHLKRDYCWPLIKRMSLFSLNGQRNADRDIPVMMMSSIGLQPQQCPTTASSPSVSGVPSTLNRQNNAEYIRAAWWIHRPVTMRKATVCQAGKHRLRVFTAPVQKYRQACLCMACSLL